MWESCPGSSNVGAIRFTPKDPRFGGVQDVIEVYFYTSGFTYAYFGSAAIFALIPRGKGAGVAVNRYLKTPNPKAYIAKTRGQVP